MRTRKYLLGYALLLIFLLVVIPCERAPDADSNPLLNDQLLTSDGYTIASPISISFDEQFSFYPGNGTEEDPYRIDGYQITSTTGDPCIAIYRTEAWFKISNCRFIGLDERGVYVQDAENGIIVDNECLDCDIGIAITSGFRFQISRNIITNCTTGITALNIFNCEISNNTIKNGHDGIYLSFASFSIVQRNTCTNFTFRALYLRDSNRNKIQYNTLTLGDVGVDIDDSNSNTLGNNTISHCDYGVLVTDSRYNEISDNTFENNDYGVYFFARNTGNYVSWNTFLPLCTFNAHDDQVENHFFYNFYWNYIGNDSDDDGYGDNPYRIHGNGGNNDIYPLAAPLGEQVNDTTPPLIIYQFETTVLQYDEVIQISPIIFDISNVTEAILSYSVNNDLWSNLTMIRSGALWSAELPAQSPGDNISFRILAWDTFGNLVISSTWNYSLAMDTYPPSFPDDQSWQGSTQLHYLTEFLDYFYFRTSPVDNSSIESVVLHYSFEVSGVQHSSGDIEMSYNTSTELWEVFVNIEEPLSQFDITYFFTATDMHGNAANSTLRRERVYVTLPSPTTNPNPDTTTQEQFPVSNPSLILLTATLGIITIVVIMELRERRVQTN